MTCGISQWSVLSPLLSLLYINDQPEYRNHTDARLFPDDTHLTGAGRTLHEVKTAVNSDLEGLRRWLQANILSINVAKIDEVSLYK